MSVLPECEQRFRSLEARQKSTDGQMRECMEGLTKSLVRIEHHADQIGASVEEFRGLTATFSALDKHLSVHSERFKVAGVLSKLAGATFVALIASAVTYFFR